jgi:antitoxin PrlF
MPTRITVKGQVTIPKRVREVLRLSPGDCVEFDVNTSGEIVVHKAQLLPAPSARRRDGVVHPRVEAQMRRRAAELLALLRGLD